jgi:hypothetical protein
MNGHGGMVRRTSGLTARVLRRRANEKLSARHLRFASRWRSVRQKLAAYVLLVDNKGKTSHVRSFFRLEVQVHSRNRHDAPWQPYMQVFIKSATFRSPLQATLLFRRGARACAVEKVFFVLLAVCCLQPLTTNAQTNPST